MFRAGSNLSDKSEEEIFYRDYKKFSIGEITVGVGQVNCMSQEEIEGLIKKEASYITSVTDKSDEIKYCISSSDRCNERDILCYVIR